MNEVYVICMSCGHSLLIELPNWDESLPKCPYCDESMIDGNTLMKDRKPLSPRQILIISITMLIIGLVISFLWSAFMRAILYG